MYFGRNGIPHGKYQILDWHGGEVVIACIGRLLACQLFLRAAAVRDPGAGNAADLSVFCQDSSCFLPKINLAAHFFNLGCHLFPKLSGTFFRIHELLDQRSRICLVIRVKQMA